MKNLMSADFYKIFKNKSLWICSFLVIALSIGTVFLLDFTFSIFNENTQNVTGENTQDVTDGNLQIGLSVNTDMPSNESGQDTAMFMGEPEAYKIFSQSLGSNVTIFVAIIISIFVGAEFGLGTIKNTATKSFSRTKIYLSKLFVSIIVSDLLFILFAGVFMITAIGLWGFGTPPAGFGLSAVKEFGLQLLLNTAYASLFVAAAVFLRSSGGAIALNISLITFSSTIVSLVDMLIQRVFHIDFMLSDYLISTNISALTSQELTNSLAIRSLLVGICYLAVTIAAGLFDINKRDIK